ncbi:hypothetical protein HH310_37900 [Actinoplanes sp. TBRC 11911]|uniref:hypothetical protein n=1 Tax=Actinoplanes sp. TBRC 11911 TaxID=2729386 RepID=UPI00145DB567|nr:hypothetical protein [Actinoplanes sp. TBRC 11911]NMO56936.1 hypothetical protein [Actinoplanes sp. TBRC 11911]
MTQPKPNRDDWKDSGGGWFPPSTVPTSDLNDYRTWAQTPGGWAMIKAAVNGGSGLSTDAQRAHANQMVSAQSVVDGAAAFQRTYETLAWLETFVRDHSKAIAGDGKPWQGAAANAFVAKMEWFAKYLGAQAERISGADGTGGIGSVPNQLNKSANYLAWAQQTLDYLDTAYAGLSKDAGNGSGGDGLVNITGSAYEKPMTDQMLQVVDTLAGQYDLTYSSVTPPQGNGDPPITTPNLSDITTPNMPNLTPPGGSPPPDISTPNFNGPGGGGGGGSNQPDITTPNISLPNFAAHVTPPNISTPGINPPPTGGGLPGLDLPKPPGGVNLPKPPGGVDLPKPPGSVLLPKPPAGGNLPKPPAGGNLPKPPGGVNVPKPPGGVNLPKPPGGVNLPPPPTKGGGIGDGIDIPGGVKGGIGGPGAGGLGGAGQHPGGAPGGGVNLPDAPDSGGLLTGDQSDWQPHAFDGIDVPDAPGGAVPGGSGLGGLPGGGQPGGAPGAGGGVNLPDASDAGGLLTGDADDWHSQDLAVDGPAAPGGAMPGGAGLGPGGGAPAGAGTTLPERPDAAGLVDGDESDWGDGEGVPGPDAPAGVTAGGAGLTVTELVPDHLVPLPQREAPAAYTGTTAPGDRPEASDLVEADAEVWATDAPMVPVTAMDIPVVPKDDEKHKRDALVAVPIVPVIRPAGPVTEVDVVVPAVPPPAGEADEAEQVALQRATAEVEEREEPDRPDAAELLAEDTEHWEPETEPNAPAQDGDHVPVVRPEEKVGDTGGWDDGADWLHDERVTDV